MGQKATEKPWDSKKPTLIWRGSTTGAIYTPENYDKTPRSRLVLACQNDPLLNMTGGCDAGFIKYVQGAKEMESLMLKTFGPNLPKVSMEEHMDYKYIAWLDGNGPCSGRSEKLVLGTSLLFKEESKHIEFYYSGLKPGIHYLPIDPSMSDLAEKVAWAREHDDDAKQIVNNLVRFQNQLSPKSVDCYVAGLLEAYAELLAYKPKPIKDYPNARIAVPGNDMGIQDSCTNPIFACKGHAPTCNPQIAPAPHIRASLGLMDEPIDRCWTYSPLPH